MSATRVVLDTACFVTAMRSSSGAAGEVIRGILGGKVIALMDLKLSLEYRDVALRPQHLIVSGLSEREMLRSIELFEAFAEPVSVSQKFRPLSVDPDDDMVLDLAINGRADAIVTSNTKHFADPGRRFGISIYTPAQLLEYLRVGDQHGN